MDFGTSNLLLPGEADLLSGLDQHILFPRDIEGWPIGHLRLFPWPHALRTEDMLFSWSWHPLKSHLLFSSSLIWLVQALVFYFFKALVKIFLQELSTFKMSIFKKQKLRIYVLASPQVGQLLKAFPGYCGHAIAFVHCCSGLWKQLFTHEMTNSPRQVYLNLISGSVLCPYLEQSELKIKGKNL